MLTMLGIPNCSTVKKARVFLEERGVDFSFRDVRADPLTAEEWQGLIEQDGENVLVNTRSPSFRRTGIAKELLDEKGKLTVLLAEPTAMKRPVLLSDGTVAGVGFTPDDYEQILERAGH